MKSTCLERHLLFPSAWIWGGLSPLRFGKDMMSVRCSDFDHDAGGDYVDDMKTWAPTCNQST